MKLFVWNRARRATDNYHDEGGIIAIAETLGRARELLAAQCDNEDGPCSAMTAEPDLVRDCEGPEYIAIHPDAGCC